MSVGFRSAPSVALPGALFWWEQPERGVPVLLEVPHAGVAIPEPEARRIDVQPEVLWLATDLFVDRFAEGGPRAGASVLAARVSRLVVDLNRAEDDVSRLVVPDHPAPRPRRSRGVVWARALDGRPLLRAPLSYAELQQRLDRYYRPYHRALAAWIEGWRRVGRPAVVLALHSMLPEGPDGRRADVVPGTLGRRSAAPAVVDAVDRCFREAGLSVAHDAPYRGGFTTEHYGRPEQGVHVVQIEFNRALYADWRTGRPDEGAIARLAGLVEDLVGRVTEALEAL